MKKRGIAALLAACLIADVIALAQAGSPAAGAETGDMEVWAISNHGAPLTGAYVAEASGLATEAGAPTS